MEILVPYMLIIAQNSFIGYVIYPLFKFLGVKNIHGAKNPQGAKYVRLFLHASVVCKHSCTRTHIPCPCVLYAFPNDWNWHYLYLGNARGTDLYLARVGIAFTLAKKIISFSSEILKLLWEYRRQRLEDMVIKVYSVLKLRESLLKSPQRLFIYFKYENCLSVYKLFLESWKIFETFRLMRMIIPGVESLFGSILFPPRALPTTFTYFKSHFHSNYCYMNADIPTVTLIFSLRGILAVCKLKKKDTVRERKNKQSFSVFLIILLRVTVQQ